MRGGQLRVASRISARESLVALGIRRETRSRIHGEDKKHVMPACSSTSIQSRICHHRDTYCARDRQRRVDRIPSGSRNRADAPGYELRYLTEHCTRRKHGASGDTWSATQILDATARASISVQICRLHRGPRWPAAVPSHSGTPTTIPYKTRCVSTLGLSRDVDQLDI